MRRRQLLMAGAARPVYCLVRNARGKTSPGCALMKLLGLTSLHIYSQISTPSGTI
jgi:hypothetical protein